MKLKTNETLVMNIYAGLISQEYTKVQLVEIQKVIENQTAFVVGLIKEMNGEKVCKECGETLEHRENVLEDLDNLADLVSEKIEWLENKSVVKSEATSVELVKATSIQVMEGLEAVIRGLMKTVESMLKEREAGEEDWTREDIQEIYDILEATHEVYKKRKGDMTTSKDVVIENPKTEKELKIEKFKKDIFRLENRLTATIVSTRLLLPGDPLKQSNLYLIEEYKTELEALKEEYKKLLK